MEWYLTILIIIGSLLVLMSTGLPVAFAFMVVNIIGVYFLWGGGPGMEQLIDSFFSSITSFTFIPLPLFILMGDFMFHSGIAVNMIDALDKWLGRLPGRLSLLAVASGTVLSTLTGASIASTAILGSTLVPEMEKRGYKKPMTLGPILGSGGLAIMIPPSSIAVFLAAIAVVSIGKLLVAAIIPGLLMAALYAAYIITRCQLQPSIAQAYDVAGVPISVKLLATVRYILPVGFIIFMVIGVILIGIATPTEAAATGTVGVVILIAIYRKLNWPVIKKAFSSAIGTTIMIFMIMVGAQAFSQILAFSGATRGLAQFAIALPVAPLVIIIAMQFVALILGMFMNVTPVIMICIPLFIPIVNTLGFDPLWFSAIFLINTEMAVTSPPFGLSLFVMKGVSPSGTRMGDIYRAALPFLGCDLVAVALIIAFPAIALWLPSVMG